MALTAGEYERVRAMWRDLCGASEAFRRPGLEVADAAEVRSAPPGAISIVVLGDAGVVSGQGVSAHREALTALGVGAVTDPARAETVFGPFARTLGPARLWYGRTDAAQRHEVVGPHPADHALVVELVAGASADDVDESSITELPSGVFVALDGDGRAAAGCGWHEWPHAVAHIGVLAATTHRGRGFAASAAAVALRAAAGAGLLPQWRAADRNDPSNTLAGRLGLAVVGSQLSVQPVSAPPR